MVGKKHSFTFTGGMGLDFSAAWFRSILSGGPATKPVTVEIPGRGAPAPEVRRGGKGESHSSGDGGGDSALGSLGNPFRSQL